MNLNMTRMIGSLSMFWKSHGPTICVGAGIVGAVGAGVLGAKGWHEAKLIIDHKNEELDKINKGLEEHCTVTIDGVDKEYTEADKEHDIDVVRKTAVKGIVKSLAPAVGLGIASAGLIIGGYAGRTHQLTSAVAYASSLETIIQQRDQIFRKEFGDEKVDMLYAGYRKETQEVVTKDPETGKEIITLEENLRKELDIPTDNIFRFKFKRGCNEWTPGCRDLNLAKLSIAERNLTDLLCTRRFVLVEDICDALGIDPDERTGAGQICGKLYDKTKLPEENRIVLKVDPFDDPMSDEINLIFECDGIILKGIEKNKREKYHPLKRKYA